MTAKQHGMSIAFFRSAHDLEGHTALQSILVLVISFFLIAIWTGWLCLAHIPVYRTTDSVMLLMSTGYQADAAVSGRIVAVHANLGQEVRAGDVLVDVYSGTQENQLAEARIQWGGAEKAWRTSTAIANKYSQSQAVISEIDLLRAQAQAQADRAKADSLRLEIKRLQDEIEQCQIKAPVDGRIAGLSLLQVGAFIREGDEVARIVPRGEISAVADFLPSTAAGRIHPGQPAWLHLSGFPRSQYGAVSATVVSVASEPTAPIDLSMGNASQEKRLRVELKLDPKSAPLIQLKYGLLGTAEIEVERISPIQIILRAAGEWMIRPNAS